MNETTETKQITAGDERERLIATAACVAYNATCDFLVESRVRREGELTYFGELDRATQAAAIASARYTVENRQQGADVRHRIQLGELRRAGFTWGEEFDETARTHPLAREWEQLESHERVAMRLFVAVVRSLA